MRLLVLNEPATAPGRQIHWNGIFDLIGNYYTYKEIQYFSYQL